MLFFFCFVMRIDRFDRSARHVHDAHRLHWLRRGVGLVEHARPQDSLGLRECWHDEALLLSPRCARGPDTGACEPVAGACEPVAGACEPGARAWIARRQANDARLPQR